jgi:hypothetical protein
MHDDNLPKSIPFGKFREAAAVLGINVKGVYRITIDTDKVTVYRFAKTPEGVTRVLDHNVVRFEDTIPFTIPLAAVGEQGPELVYRDDSGRLRFDAEGRNHA